MRSQSDVEPNWKTFTGIFVAMWILFIVVALLLFNIRSPTRFVSRFQYYGILMLLLTYYSGRRYKSTNSHRSYLITLIPLILLAIITYFLLRLYLSIFGWSESIFDFLK